MWWNFSLLSWVFFFLGAFCENRSVICIHYQSIWGINIFTVHLFYNWKAKYMLKWKNCKNTAAFSVGTSCCPSHVTNLWCIIATCSVHIQWIAQPGCGFFNYRFCNGMLILQVGTKMMTQHPHTFIRKCGHCWILLALIASTCLLSVVKYSRPTVFLGQLS